MALHRLLLPFPLLLLLTLLPHPAPASNAAAPLQEQDAPYPYDDPYEATIFGTPPELRFEPGTSARPEVRSFQLKDREIPDVFSYNAAMEYSLLLQDEPSPLVLIVAGTGGRYDESKMRFLQRHFHAAGYHAACVSSPTQFQFIVSMSRHALSGYVPWDTADLWKVLGWIRDQVAQERGITGVRLTGYSLGALHAAFLAERDAREGGFGFERVLLLNPPVDLYNSALLFDSWLGGGEAGMAKAEQTLELFIREFTKFSRANDLGDLDGDTLQRFFETLELDEEEYKALIASSFRMTCASMIFSSDVCLRAGYVVAPEVELSGTDPLLPYFDVAARLTFRDYFEEFLLPYIRFRDPSATREGVLRACGMESIAPFLRGAGHVRLLGTADDPILRPEEVAFLRRSFGERATLFEHGGHCGNFQYAPFARAMLELMALPGEQAQTPGRGSEADSGGGHD